MDAPKTMDGQDWGMLILLSVLWGGAYFFAGVAVKELPPLTVVLARVSLAAIALLPVFWYFGLYRGVWRFASMPDLVRIIKAVVFGVALTATTIFFVTRLEGLPRAVFPIYGLVLLGFLGGPRFIYRWFRDHSLSRGSKQNALIVGAGSAGETLVRDLTRNPNSPYLPVAFADDDTTKKKTEIHGIRVVGTCDEIPEIIKKRAIDLILIALPSATSKQVRRIVGLSEQSGVPVRILPRLADLVSGEVGIKELRDVRIDDLLGREKITLDWDAITKGLTGKSVMVTGGGGSIGSELCRQIARLNPANLIVLERSEQNLYQVDLESRKDFSDIPLITVLGDVCDDATVERVFHDYKPHVVFHAAAYKQVPMLEGQVRAAVENNIFGTRTAAAAAVKHGCQCFVLISTDKAVNPANIMGMTKRVTEIECQNRGAGSATHFVTVRFGNVLGSAGSVIPLFQGQIAAGGPVTVTHRDMKRYFMTIPEAVRLVLQAGAIGDPGEIMILDMGEPVSIVDLARRLIDHNDPSIEIEFTGLRPGEKLHETLVAEHEEGVRREHARVMHTSSPPVEHLDRLLEDLATRIRIDASELVALADGKPHELLP